MALLHSTRLYIPLPLLYLTLLDSTFLYHGSTSLHINLPWLYFTLFDSTFLYHGYTSLYLTLHYSIPWLYFTLLDSTLLYRGSTSLFFTLHDSTVALLLSSSLYMTLPWLYFTVLHYSTLALLDSTLLFHGSIYLTPVLVTILPPLFTAFVRHSYLPPNLRNCILKPIPKPHKDPTLSDSYRPIALAPTLSKILEWCILLQYSEHFPTSPLQFGFKKHMSTTLCTGLVKNISAHYMSHGCSVFACLLDASKAFDLVDHSLLFQQLLHRRTPSFIFRFLLTWL